MEYKSSKYEHVVNQREPKSGSGSSSKSKVNSIRPLAPPSSSNHTYDYVHPKRTSPHRERSRREEHRNREEYSRQPSRSPPKKRSETHTSSSARPMKTMFRKSAIQDVIKTFQCNETSVAPTTVYQKYDGKSRSSNKSGSKPSRKDPQPNEAHNALDNSLLEKDEQSAFHPFDSDSTNRDNDDKSSGRIKNWLDSQRNENGPSPLKNLLKNPIQVCREQFTEEPTVQMKESASYFERNSKNGGIYHGDKDKAFLKLKSTWGDDDLSDVFRKPSPERRRAADKVHDPFLSNGLRESTKKAERDEADAETERFKRAAMDSVKKVIQYTNDDVMKTTTSLKRGGKSPTRAVMLKSNPRDNVPSRRSPNRERQRDRSRSHSRGNSSTSSNYRGIRTVKEILKDHKYTHTPSVDSNLLDETLSDSEEETPRERNKKRPGKSLGGKTPGTGRTVQTERMTPSPLPTSNNESNHDPLLAPSETPNTLRDVKLTLFEEGNPIKTVPKAQPQHARAEVAMKDRTVQKMDHDREVNEKQIDELKTEWKRSQLQIKRMLAEEVVEWFRNEEEAGVMMTEMMKLKKSNERALAEAGAEKRAKTSLEEEHEALRKQLARYKARKFNTNKSGDEGSKIEDERSGSCISSESGSNHTTSTAFTLSEKLTMQAVIVDLKATLSEKEKCFDEQKKSHEEKEIAHKAQIHKLMRNRKDQKSNAEFTVLETQMNTLQHNVDLHKDQLKESEIYVKELEETMDNQLRVWQEEEETFRAESKELKTQSDQAAKFEEMHRAAQVQLKELQQELFHANNDTKQLLTIKENLEHQCKASVGLERSARESSEQYKETIRVLREEKEDLENLLQDLKIRFETQKELSFSIDIENEIEIKKLKEQLKHAAFRVQIMRNESPKRNRPGSADDMSEEITIAKLMQQLKVADAKAEAAWEAQRNAEESLISIHSTEIVNSSDEGTARTEIESLTRKLHEARARSRRIAVKSEEELSKLRESEGDMRILASNYEQEASKLKQKLKKIQHQYSDEFASRKRIESTLRNEISLLRQEKASSASSSSLPNSINTHSNRIGKELQHLVEIASTLHTTMSLITKAKQRIGKDILEKMMTGVEDLRAVVTKVEAAAEEDKFQIENAFIVYESAVHSYESQIEEVTNKMKRVKEELAECRLQRSEGAQKSKQAEMDMLAKLNCLKRRLSEVQKEYDAYKKKVESENEARPEFAHKEFDAYKKKVESENEVRPEFVDNSKPPMNNEPNKKTWKMKLHHGVSKGDVEMKLHEEDDSMGAATSQSITSFRSFEHSVKESSTCEDPTSRTAQEQAESTRTLKEESSSPITTDEEEEGSTDSIRSLTIDDDNSRSQASNSSIRIDEIESSPTHLTLKSESVDNSSGAELMSIHDKITDEQANDSIESTESGIMELRGDDSVVDYSREHIMELRGEDSVVDYSREMETSIGDEESKFESVDDSPLSNDSKQMEKSIGDESISDSFHSNPHDCYASDFSFDDKDQGSV